jgi:hypothetical protein
MFKIMHRHAIRDPAWFGKFRIFCASGYIENYDIDKISYVFFWVVPQCLEYKCQCFGTLSVPSSQASRNEVLHFVPTRLRRWNTQNVPKCWHLNSRHREQPKRKHMKFKTWRRFKIKNRQNNRKSFLVQNTANI